MKTGARDARPRARTMPRRRKPSVAARIKPFWIFAVVLIGLLAWGGAWLVQSPWFRVTRVGIDVPLASPVSRDAVRAAAGISRDANVWLIDTRGAARRIEAIPYVDAASIHRGQFPKPFVELAVTVRRPSACVRGGGRDVTIDATARVLQAGCATASLPRIDAGQAAVPAPGATLSDPELGRLLADAKTLSDANLAVRRLGPRPLGRPGGRRRHRGRDPVRRRRRPGQEGGAGGAGAQGGRPQAPHPRHRPPRARGRRSVEFR